MFKTTKPYASSFEFICIIFKKDRLPPMDINFIHFGTVKVHQNVIPTVQRDFEYFQMSYKILFYMDSYCTV